MFYEWLLSQRERKDGIGAFALIASTDRKFPRKSHRLYILLRYCDGNRTLRDICKKAHAEFRAARAAMEEQAVTGALRDYTEQAKRHGGVQ